LSCTLHFQTKNSSLKIDADRTIAIRW